jgi:predicted DNA-binding transcriptional regulator AlpA
MATYLRDTDLAERYSISRSTVWRWARRGMLPAPVKLSDACSRWRLEEIERRDEARDSGLA